MCIILIFLKIRKSQKQIAILQGFLSDQHILSPINPKYDNWFCQIYKDLHKFKTR